MDVKRLSEIASIFALRNRACRYDSRNAVASFVLKVTGVSCIVHINYVMFRHEENSLALMAIALMLHYSLQSKFIASMTK